MRIRDSSQFGTPLAGSTVNSGSARASLIVEGKTDTTALRFCRTAIQLSYPGGMSWPATDRYGLSHALGGLGFVQDVVNTHPTQRPPTADLLAEPGSAQTRPHVALSN